MKQKNASGSAPSSPPVKTSASKSLQSVQVEAEKPISQTSVASRRESVTAWGKIAPYAFLAFVAFVCGMVVLGLMLWKADMLVRLGLTGRVYYIVLLPLGLSVAAFLFGVLRSYAVYSGKHFGGVLELGGPIVGFVLTIVGAFILVPDQTTFPLTVFVHGEQSIDQIVIHDSGHVIMDLGPDRRREAIGDKGQAYFPAIPASFRGQEVAVFIDAEGCELAKPGLKLRLNGGALYLPVRPRTGRIAGWVQDEDGKKLAGVEIQIAGLFVKSDGTGHFEVTIPGERMKPELFLEAIVKNFAPYRTTVVPEGKTLVVTLHREP